MCGIVGYVRSQGRAEDTEALRTALQAMAHRGPDDEGITLIGPEKGKAIDLTTSDTMRGVIVRGRGSQKGNLDHSIGLGHRRFALVDPGPAGHQPFWSDDDRCSLTWNGEIYNYVELRLELEVLGYEFATSSDTEVLLTAYRHWGPRCFERFVGFWAVALFDSETHSILLARDRIGKAPLYVTRSHAGVFWASEIAALRAVCPPGTAWTVREQSVVDFLGWGVRDMGGTTFFNEVETFPAASFAWVGERTTSPVRYWQLPESRLSTREITSHEAAGRVRELLADAVRVRLRADVPIGVQVSGGLDSSSILALTAGLTDRIDAFTVAFDDPSANEEPYARAVAGRHSSIVSYHVLSPPPSDPLERLDSFARLMGEPFHSPNQLTNHAVWETIRGYGLRGVLYGAGGDEVFLGYPAQYGLLFVRHLLGRGRIAAAAREFAGYPARFSDNHIKDWVVRALLTVHPRAERWIRRRSLTPDVDPCHEILGRLPESAPPIEIEARQRANVLERLIPYWTRIDNQNSMGVPVELRCPFLDHRVLELGFLLPLEYLIRDGWTKWILRVALADELPQEVVWRRRKMGFPFPLTHWLAYSKPKLTAGLAELDCPFIDRVQLLAGYDRLIQVDPHYLWAVLSLGMWWRNWQSHIRS